MNTLILMLDYYIKVCENTHDSATQKAFAHQAFGCVQYHIMVFPNSTQEVEKLWNEVYKPQFDKYFYKWS